MADKMCQYARLCGIDVELVTNHVWKKIQMFLKSAWNLEKNALNCCLIES